MTFIFIAGASGSGKSTLTKRLCEQFTTLDIPFAVLKMDDYSTEAPDGIEDMETYRETTNFDRLEMYDLALLKIHLLNLAHGESIEKPVFDFSQNKRTAIEIIPSRPYIIIEGLFALIMAKELIEITDKLTVFIGQSSYLHSIKMRSSRDNLERGFSEEQTSKKEKKFVGPCFFDLIAKSKTKVDIDITNDMEMMKESGLNEGIKQILNALNITPATPSITI